LIVGSSQEPKPVKKDSTTVATRAADTLYLEQRIAKIKLDSIIKEKKKKK